MKILDRIPCAIHGRVIAVFSSAIAVGNDGRAPWLIQQAIRSGNYRTVYDKINGNL